VLCCVVLQASPGNVQQLIHPFTTLCGPPADQRVAVLCCAILSAVLCSIRVPQASPEGVQQLAHISAAVCGWRADWWV
jgi:hypothetical protein